MLPITATATGITVALITAAAAVLKKFIAGKRPDHVTRPEFHQSIDALRDRIDASHSALVDKIDLNHRDVLSAINGLANTTEHRLDRLDSSVARLDERTSANSITSLP